MAVIQLLPKPELQLPSIAPEKRTVALLAGIAGSAAVLSAASALEPSPFEVLGGAALTGVAAVLALVAAGVLVWLTLRLRSREAKVDNGLEWIQELQLCPSTVIGHRHDSVPSGHFHGVESLALRTLRAQVRTLEQALDEQQCDLPPWRTRSADEADAAFRRDVLTTIRALSLRTPAGESPGHTLARVTAAVERLGGPTVLARPVLTPAAQVRPLRAPAPAAPPAAAESLAAPHAEPGNEYTEQYAGSATDVASDLDHATAETEPADIPAVPRAVLPVPAWVSAEDSQRGRRWFRRAA